MKALEDMNANLVDENRCLKAELQNASNSLKLMKQELNNSQQYSRRDCLEIKGIPIQRNEVTNEVVKSVGNLIGVEVKDEDISSVTVLLLSRIAKWVCLRSIRQ